MTQQNATFEGAGTRGWGLTPKFELGKFFVQCT